MLKKRLPRSTRQYISPLIWVFVVITALNTAPLLAREVLVVDTYASVAYLNERGEVDGPVAAVIKEVCRRMGQDVTFTFNPIQRMFANLESHKADAAFNMSHNVQRANNWHYSKPIHQVFYGVFSHQNSPLHYQSRNDLEDYTIVTYGPTNMSKKVEAFAQSISGSKVKIMNHYESAFKMLSGGRFGKKAVVYAPDTVGFDVIKKWGLHDKIRLAGRDIKNLYYVVFVKKRVKKSFVDEFNLVLLQIHKTGKMAEIYGRYTDKVKATPPSIDDMLQFPPIGWVLLGH